MDRISIDATNPYNPFGFTFDPATNPFVVTRRPVEAGPRRFEQVVNTFYASGGLGGNFDVGKQRFFWDTTVGYGVNRADQLRNNSFNSAKLEQALGPAFQDGEGVWRCGTAENPGDPECVPFNIFGGQGSGNGTITPEMLDYVTFVQHDVSEQTLVDVVGNMSGALAELPAGALSVAAGIEHRRLQGFFEPDPIVVAGDGADVPSKPTSGSYWVNEAYAEVRAPAGHRRAGHRPVRPQRRGPRVRLLDPGPGVHRQAGRALEADEGPHGPRQLGAWVSARPASASCTAASRATTRR